jgi:hypothetical protein
MEQPKDLVPALRTYPAVRSYRFGPPERLDLNPMCAYVLETSR